MTRTGRRRLLRSLVGIAAVVGTRPLESLALDGPLRWTDFAWHAVVANGQRLERAALLVPAMIVGLPGRHALQLDTGAHLNFLHGGAIADVDPAYAARLGRAASITGEIAGVPVTGERFSVTPEYRAVFTRGEPTPVIGVIGLPFLERRAIIIDYPRARLAVLDAGLALPTTVLRKTTFSPLDYRNGKIYLPVTIDGETRAEYFLDTGASLFPLTTTEDEWRRLTRREVDDRRNQRYTLPSLNDTWLEMIGAPMTGRLSVGPVKANRPLVFFVNDARFRIDAMPRTRGLLGNALFVREHAIVIDLPGQRIGFIRSADLPRD